MCFLSKGNIYISKAGANFGYAAKLGVAVGLLSWHIGVLISRQPIYRKFYFFLFEIFLHVFLDMLIWLVTLLNLYKD